MFGNLVSLIWCFCCHYRYFRARLISNMDRMITLHDDFVVAVVFTKFRSSFKLTVLVRCSSQWRCVAVSVSCWPPVVDHQCAWSSWGSRRQTSAASNHRRRKERWNESSAGIPQHSPGRARGSTWDSLLWQTLQQRTWLVQVDNRQLHYCFTSQLVTIDIILSTAYLSIVLLAASLSWRSGL